MTHALPSALAIRDHVAAGRRSALQTVRDALDRLQRVQPHCAAFLQVFHDSAIDAARAIDARRDRGEPLGPLAGVPVAVKDNICLAHGRTTCASRMLEHYQSPFTATALQRLIDADAVVIGKTNLDEFAMGSSGEYSAFGPTRNPWDTTRVPGGSSGGSAAAVAAGVVPIALGSDTGGSIRQPASHCGVVGLKPTYGRVSRYGLVAFASSLDQIGPIASSIADAALALSVIAGKDPADATSADRPVPDFTADLDQPIQGLRLGVPARLLDLAQDDSVRNAFHHALATARAMGAQTVEIDLPHADLGVAAYYLIATAEASSNLARYDGVRFGRRAPQRPGDDAHALIARSRTQGLGPEVKRRILLGTFVLSAGYYDQYYATALRARRLIRDDYLRAFDAPCHAILTPAAPGPAFRIGEKTSDPLALYLEDLFTVGVNLAGLPAVVIPSAPARRDGATLPVGVQIIAPHWHEHTLLRIARMFERADPAHAPAPAPLTSAAAPPA